MERNVVLHARRRHRHCALDIGFEERRRIPQRIIVVALRGEMHNLIGRLHQLVDEGLVAHIADDQFAQVGGGL